MPGLRPEFIALNNVNLRNLGMKPQAADILSQSFADLDVRPFLNQTAEYLRVSTADVVNWFNQWGPESLRGFAGMGLHLIRPDAKGKYQTSPTSHGPFLMQSIGDMVQHTKLMGRPMPAPVVRADAAGGHKKT
jgi:hypothetical protein